MIINIYLRNNGKATKDSLMGLEDQKYGKILKNELISL